MHILGAGRSAFLEFLRNLAPIVLLMSIAFAMGVQLDFKRFQWSNWLVTLAFYACAVTAAWRLLPIYRRFSTMRLSRHLVSSEP